MTFSANVTGFASIISGIESMIDVQLKDDTVFIVGTNVEYAVYQEYGTRHMEPQSFLRPAARDVKRNIGEVIKNAESMEAATEEVALQIERRAKELAPVDTGNLRSSITTERVN